jgi:hypothetical protein
MVGIEPGTGDRFCPTGRMKNFFVPPPPPIIGPRHFDRIRSETVAAQRDYTHQGMKVCFRQINLIVRFDDIRFQCEYSPRFLKPPPPRWQLRSFPKRWKTINILRGLSSKASVVHVERIIDGQRSHSLREIETNISAAFATAKPKMLTKSWWILARSYDLCQDSTDWTCKGLNRAPWLCHSVSCTLFFNIKSRRLFVIAYVWFCMICEMGRTCRKGKKCIQDFSRHTWWEKTTCEMRR